MSWKDKAVALVKRFGAPAKFAAKLVLGAVLPGGGAVVELVEKVLDCAHDTIKDNLEANEAKAPAATAADLDRVAEVLDVLGGDLSALTEKIASLEKLPQEASRTLESAMATDARCQAGFRRLDDLARRFDRLEEQNRQLLKGQGYAAQGCLTGTIADNGALTLFGAVHSAEGRWDVRINGEVFVGGMRGQYTSQFQPNAATQGLLAVNAMWNPLGAALQATAAMQPRSGMFALQKQF